MEPENLEDRLRRHEAMIEGLAKVWMRQSELNERMDRYIERQDAINERLEQQGDRFDRYMARMDGYMERMEGYMQRQEGVNAAVSSTLADIRRLLERVVGGSGNGREA